VALKFEQLEVWQLALEHIDLIDGISHQLPRSGDIDAARDRAR
jgi:hypothetical protein